MARAFRYIRYSSPEQRKGDSVRRQNEGARRFCEHRGLDLANDPVFLDDGLSAYHEDNLAEGSAFNKLLDAARKGVIKPGDWIVIENPDRVSRGDPWDGIDLFRQLRKMGIHFGTVSPEKEYRADSKDPMDLFSLVMELTRGNSESDRKAYRLQEHWAQNQELAAPDRPVTAACPAWLRVVGARKSGSRRIDFGHYEMIPERVAILREIYSLCLGGLGARNIANVLNDRKIPAWCKLPRDLPADQIETWQAEQKWSHSTVRLYLTDDRVLGNYTSGKDTVKPGVFPAVIDETTFQRVQQIRQQRGGRKTGGRHFGDGSNLFTLVTLVDEEDGSHWYYQGTLSQKGGKKYAALVNRQGLDRGAKWKSFPYPLFEKCFLAAIHEVQLADLLDGQQQESSRQREKVAAELSKNRNFQTRYQEQIDTADDPDVGIALVPKLTKLIKEERALQAELEELGRQLATPLETALPELKEALSQALTQKEFRVQARQRIATVVKEIHVYLAENTRARKFLEVSVLFHHSNHIHSFSILYRPQARAKENFQGRARNSQKPVPQEKK